MNIIVWLVQILLALHTGAGAIWKLMNPSALVPMFPQIYPSAWLIISVVELIVAAMLLLPLVHKPGARYVSVAAGFVFLEMLTYSGLYFVSTFGMNMGPLYYWLSVALVAGVLAYIRRPQRIVTL